MKTTPSSVIEKMTTMDDNPLDFDDMVSTWNAFCDESWSEHAEDFQFADIKSAAISVLSDDRDVGGSRQIGNEISRMLSTFEYPAILVGSNARVAAANTAALKEFDLDFGDKIDQLPYSLDSAQNISELIKKSLNSTEADPAGVVLKRAFGIGNEREATIAITTSIAKVSTALVFVISTQWKSSSAELIKRQFALTNTETEVLISFVNGYSSKDIAKQRKRSHATVRTQFQTILAKTGARNQSELLRICLSVSDFVGKIDVITDAVNHPHRRRSEVLAVFI